MMIEWFVQMILIRMPISCVVYLLCMFGFFLSFSFFYLQRPSNKITWFVFFSSCKPVWKCVFFIVGLNVCVCVFCILSRMIRPWDACHAHRWYLLFRLENIELTKAMALSIEILLASISILWMRKNCQTS